MRNWKRSSTARADGNIFANDPDCPARSAGELKLPGSEFNDNAVPLPGDLLVHELFEEQVRRTPGLTAVQHGERSITYAELDHRANQLARHLREREVSERVVALCVERSIEMVIGMLGILKAGGAYLPLDPHYPLQRLQLMLEDAAPQLVLTQTSLLSIPLPTAAPIVTLDTLLDAIGDYSGANLSDHEPKTSSLSLLYVIYTSGSTGTPKGTAMPHRSMINLLEWHRRNIELNAGQRVLQFAALSFDVAFQEIFSTLCGGGTLVLVNEAARRDANALWTLLTQQSIERAFLPPLVLQGLANCFPAMPLPPPQPEPPIRLRDIIVAGEQLRITPQIVRLFQCLDHCRLHNHYGPTESHVVTALTLTGDPTQWPALPSIGRPIANTQIHILDEQRRPVPFGAEGEIYIGGANVARGYLRRSELTAERFIKDPFSTDPSARLYKTGDLGRWTSDGTIEYLGRNDDQVKIRGFRIELAEIESQLARHAAVKEVAVAVREDDSGDKRLVAYVTLNDASAATIDNLRASLSEGLPEHMVPRAIVVLESLPRTPSGKLDRRALPAPTLDAYSRRAYEPPEGAIEEALARLWQALLKVERVGRHDNFFELGGHSLSIVHMIERMRELGFSADASTVFDHATLADLAAALAGSSYEEIPVPPNLIAASSSVLTPQMLPLVQLQQEHIDRIVQSVPGGVANIQDIYPLAPLQEGMLFHHLSNEQGSDTYVLTALLAVSSRGNLDKLIAGLRATIERHDVLRTAILWEHLPRPVQIVYRRAMLPVEELEPDPALDPVAQLKELMQPSRQRLDLRRAPLMRLYVAADPASQQCHALLQLHHLICDHEALDTLIAEVSACIKGHSTKLPKSRPYREHVAHTLRESSERNAELFFREKLLGVDEPTAPFALLDVHADAVDIDESSRLIDAGLAKAIRSHARYLGVSPAILFHAAWALVVARTSGRDDVVFGTLLLGRLQGGAGASSALGMFMNTLPLRLQLQGLTARGLVKQAQHGLTELLRHEQASLAVAQRCSGITGSSPLFTALLNYRHGAPDRGEVSAEFRVLDVREWTNYPFTLSVDDLGEDFGLTAQAHRSVAAQRLIEYTCVALNSLTQELPAGRRPVLELPVLSEAERKELIHTLNPPATPYLQDRLIQDLFEQCVRRSPHAVALACGTESLTYSELNDRANRLANVLRKQGVAPGTLVAVCLNRSVDLVVGLVAIIKAGAGYVPMDPSYPVDRVTYMLRDCAPAAVLTQLGLKLTLPEIPVPVIAIDAIARELEVESADNLDVTAGLPSEQLAYVIYTSGSTGEPKGVRVTHRNLMNLLAWTRDTFDVSEGTRCPFLAAVGFDAAAWEIWLSLSSGATLVVPPPAVSNDLDALLHWWEEESLDVTFMTTAIAELTFRQGIRNSNLRVLWVGGDRLRSRPAADSHLLVNNYGPTEITVICTSGAVRPQDEVLHIGRPIANTRIYIVDENLQLAPRGVAGEICIGGAGVAQGYLNRPDLTAQRFVLDPFSAEPQARMYRSGDLGRWLPDGTIEFLGRRDFQVKIRGYRIELGEIEAQLLRHPQVEEAVVLARDEAGSEKRLVAYVVPRPASDTNAALSDMLRSHLRPILPQYMIPSAFVTLQRLPITRNGKLDARALPSPEPEAYVSREYESPQDAVERLLADVWQEVLHAGRVGRHDNFFDLGGNSISAMQMIVRVRSALAIDVPMKSLFESPTVAQLSAHVQQLRDEQFQTELANEDSDLALLLAEVAAVPDGEVMERLRQLRMRT